MIALTGGVLLANWRMAEAAGGAVRFARPDYGVARAGAVIDLAKYGALADAARLSGLSKDVQACHDALAAAGVQLHAWFRPSMTAACGYNEAVVVQASLSQWEAPEAMPMTCDLAAKMHLWERHIVIPAAEKYLGSPVGGDQGVRFVPVPRAWPAMTGCRNTPSPRRLDIAGFVLEDGREISVLKRLPKQGRQGRFPARDPRPGLRPVRCDLGAGLQRRPRQPFPPRCRRRARLSLRPWR